MYDLERIKELGEIYDKQYVKRNTYIGNHVRLCGLVDEFGMEATACATGLSLSTVQQHYRNKSGTAMISTSKLDRADAIFNNL